MNSTTSNQLQREAILLMYGDGIFRIHEASTNSNNSETDSTEKNCIVLISEKLIPGAPTQLLLSSILTACKLADNKVLIKDDFTGRNDLKELILTHQPKVLLLFGLTASEIGLPVLFPHFQVQAHDGMRYLSAPALEVLGADKSAKQQLWNCLKKIFSI